MYETIIKEERAHELEREEGGLHRMDWRFKGEL